MNDMDELFDPAFLGRLRALFFQLRRRQQLRRRGPQHSASSGLTRQFKDHRQYSPGDDFRSVDWRLFARLEKLFVRVFEEIQEFHVHLLVDTSRSMLEPYPEKRRTALRVAIALAYLALAHQHRVSIMTLGQGLERLAPPLKGQGHLLPLARKLADLGFSAPSDLTASLRSFRPAVDRRGIVFVISDLFGREVSEAAEALQAAKRWPTQTHVIHVYHPREADPGVDGEVRLVDVETQESRRLMLTRRDLQTYRDVFTHYQEELRETCARQQIEYTAWTTDQAFEDTFVALLSRGSALAQA